MGIIVYKCISGYSMSITFKKVLLSNCSLYGSSGAISQLSHPSRTPARDPDLPSDNHHWYFHWHNKEKDSLPLMLQVLKII